MGLEIQVRVEDGLGFAGGSDSSAPAAEKALFAVTLPSTTFLQVRLVMFLAGFVQQTFAVCLAHCSMQRLLGTLLALRRLLHQCIKTQNWAGTGAAGGGGGGEKCGDACRMIETTCTWKHTANIAKCVNEWQQQKKSMAPNTDSSSRNEKDRRKARAA